MNVVPKSSAPTKVIYMDYSNVPVRATFEDIRRINPTARAPLGERRPADCFRRRGPSQRFVFPTKLHEILTRPEFSHVITWMEHGRSWRVIDRQAFTEQVMPKYFAQTKYPSFIRQVNGWGFRRITQGQDNHSYYNDLFLRSMQHLVQFMTRHPAARQGRNEPEPNLRAYAILPPLTAPAARRVDRRLVGESGEHSAPGVGHTGHEHPTTANRQHGTRTSDNQGDNSQNVHSATGTTSTDTAATTNSREFHSAQGYAYHRHRFQEDSNSRTADEQQGNQRHYNATGEYHHSWREQNRSFESGNGQQNSSTSTTTSHSHSFRAQGAAYRHHARHVQEHSNSISEHSHPPGGHWHENTNFENGHRHDNSTSRSVSDLSYLTTSHEATPDCYHWNASTPQYSQGGQVHYGHSSEVGHPNQTSAADGAHQIARATTAASGVSRRDYHHGAQMGQEEGARRGCYDDEQSGATASRENSSASSNSQWSPRNRQMPYTGAYTAHSEQPREQRSLQQHPSAFLSTADASEKHGRIEERQATTTSTSSFPYRGNVEPMIGQTHHEGAQMGPAGESARGCDGEPINTDRESAVGGTATSNWSPIQNRQASHPSHTANDAHQTEQQPREQLAFQQPSTTSVSADAADENDQSSKEQQQATVGITSPDRNNYEPLNRQPSSIGNDWDEGLVAKLSCQLKSENK